MNKKNNKIIYLQNEDIENKILNEKNIFITKKFINNLFKKIDFNYKVKNLKIFQQAMVHSSYLKNNLKNNVYNKNKLIKNIDPINNDLKKKCVPLQEKSYERLEFLGDSIIRHSIGKYLFMRYENEDEGFLSTNRSKIENKKSLSNLSKKLGIIKYIIISRSLEYINGREINTTLSEDVFEAFVGALNLEVSDNMTVEFIWKIIDLEMDLPEIIRTEDNYKDQLMKYFHKTDIKKNVILYEDNEINDNTNKYKTIVKNKINNNILGIGYGRSKKSSQQKAAKNALIKLNIIGNKPVEEEYFDYKGDIEKEINKTRKII